MHLHRPVFDIAANRPEVRTDRVEVLNVSDFTFLDQPAQLANAVIEQKDVTDHQHDTKAISEASEVLGLFSRHAERFFHEHMFARVHRVRGDRGVRGDRSGSDSTAEEVL